MIKNLQEKLWSIEVTLFARKIQLSNKALMVSLNRNQIYNKLKWKRLELKIIELSALEIRITIISILSKTKCTRKPMYKWTKLDRSGKPGTNHSNRFQIQGRYLKWASFNSNHNLMGLRIGAINFNKMQQILSQYLHISKCKDLRLQKRVWHIVYMSSYN